MATSTRFADSVKNRIANSELHIFEDCSHAAIYEDVAGFNEVTLAFLNGHRG
jgi:pimeloyl-ACP methyl ester carboxylesterase